MTDDLSEYEDKAEQKDDKLYHRCIGSFENFVAEGYRKSTEPKAVNATKLQRSKQAPEALVYA